MTAHSSAGRVLALLALGAVAACSDSTDPGARTPTALSLASRAVAVGVGDTIRLVARVTDRRAGILANEAVQWRSLDVTKASVAPTTGLVVALDTGTARIVATARGFADTATVRIARRVASLTLQAPDSLIAGAAELLPVVARDASGQVIPDAVILWQSSDTTLLAFNAAGRAFAIREGTATVRAISGAARAEAAVRTRYRRMQFGFVPTQLALGDNFTCGLDAQGQAWCSGIAAGVGRGPNPTPGFGPVTTSERFARLDGGNGTACGITAAGRTLCWGTRAGAGTSPTTGSATRDVPTPIMDSVPMRSATIGTEGANCVLAVDGRAFCWGRDDAYQTGTSPLNQNPTTPRAAQTAERFVALDVGMHSTCGVATDGVPVCWGEFPDWYDQTWTPSLRFVRYPGAPPLVSVAINGYAAACGLTASGETWCWGTISVGDLGGPTTRFAPTRKAGIPAMKQLVGSLNGICGLGIDGEVWCWGDQVSNAQPVRWRAPYNFRAIDLPRFSVTPCGVTTEGEVIC